MTAPIDTVEADRALKPRMMAFDMRESRGLVDMTFSGLLGPGQETFPPHAPGCAA